MAVSTLLIWFHVTGFSFAALSPIHMSLAHHQLGHQDLHEKNDKGKKLPPKLIGFKNTEIAVTIRLLSQV